MSPWFPSLTVRPIRAASRHYDMMFYILVTEREVRRGIINAPDVEEHCLAYLRIIKSMNLQALRYVDNILDRIEPLCEGRLQLWAQMSRKWHGFLTKGGGLYLHH